MTAQAVKHDKSAVGIIWKKIIVFVQVKSLSDTHDDSAGHM
jgi:hypothetical protein